MTITNADTIKVNLRGTRTGGEEWSTGFHLLVGPEGVTTQAVLDAIRGEVATQALQLWQFVLRDKCSPSTDFNQVQCLYYPAGSATADLQSEEAVVADVGSSQTPHPYEVAAVCSLRTAIPTRSGRGRMYLPVNGMPLTAVDQYGNADLVEIADGMATFFNALNGFTAGFTVNLAVAVASHTQGIARPVQTIIVDSLPDIQRRRGNQLSPSNTQTRVLP